jgi:hypothetical protein
MFAGSNHRVKTIQLSHRSSCGIKPEPRRTSTRSAAGGAWQLGPQGSFATPLERRRAETPILSERTYLGQIQPAPLGLGKQPTDCGSSCFGSHSTTSGNSTVKAMVKKNTM